MSSIHQKIQQQIDTTPEGAIIFPTNFRGLGTDDAIRQALSRLVKEGGIDRLAHGIYYIPKIHPAFGKLKPSMEEVAEAVAAREHIRIRPAGAYALNKLGLSTQVPAKLVYITDGQARQINIGKGGVKFKPVSPKKFGMKGKISSLVIQALEELKENQQTQDILMKIKELLLREDRGNLLHDLKLAPAKVNNVIFKLLNDPKI